MIGRNMENHDKKYTVYKHTSPEGKVYIGCTSLTPERRWNNGYQHNREFDEDIERLGWDNFEHEIISSSMSEADAYDLEKELIHKYNSTDPDRGYNKSTGGKYSYGFRHSEDTKRKLSEMKQGERNYWYGKHHTEDTKRKISISHIGKHHTEDTKRKLSEMKRGERNVWYGKHHTEETKRKLSEATSGKNHYMYGKHHTEETKRKMSESRRGKNNPMYGKHPHCKKVVCIETNKVYNSIGQAAMDIGCSISSISSACRGKQNKAGGYHWAYFD